MQHPAGERRPQLTASLRERKDVLVHAGCLHKVSGEMDTTEKAGNSSSAVPNNEKKIHHGQRQREGEGLGGGRGE